MTTYHAGEDRDLDSHIGDTKNIDDNESTNSSETMIAIRGSEADGCLSDLPNSKADLHILTREIHSLWQCIEPKEGKPAEVLGCIDCLEWELWTLSLSACNSNTHRTIWKSGVPIHGHTVHHTKADTSYQLPTTGHCCLQCNKSNKIKGMVNQYRNSSASHYWKLS